MNALRKAALAPALALLASCSPEPCTLQVWLRTAPAMAQANVVDISDAELIGSWNGWKRPGRKGFVNRRSHDGLDWMGLATSLPEGTWQYAVVLNDTLLLDEANPLTAFATDPLGHSSEPFGTEVSQITLVPDSRPAIAELSLAPEGAEGLALTARVTSKDSPRLTLALRRGSQALDAPALSIAADEDGWIVTAKLSSLAAGKYTATLSAADGSLAARSASAFVGSAFTGSLEDGLIYQVMVDRFRGPGPLAAPAGRSTGCARRSRPATSSSWG